MREGKKKTLCMRHSELLAIQERKALRFLNISQREAQCFFIFKRRSANSIVISWFIAAAYPPPNLTLTPERRAERAQAICQHDSVVRAV